MEYGSKWTCHLIKSGRTWCKSFLFHYSWTVSHLKTTRKPYPYKPTVETLMWLKSVCLLVFVDKIVVLLHHLISYETFRWWLFLFSGYVFKFLFLLIFYFVIISRYSWRKSADLTFTAREHVADNISIMWI